MTTGLLKGDPTGDIDAENILDELREAKKKLIDEQHKFNLLTQLQSKGLVTRDIMSFVSQQSNVRTYERTPDRLTARRAMSAKINDSYNSIRSKQERFKQLKTSYLGVIDNKRFELKMRRA